MKAPRLLAPAAVAAILTTGAIGGPPTSGQAVALKHLAAATELAIDRVNLTTDYSDLAVTIWDHGCALPRQVRRRQDPAARQFADLYIHDYCRPWVAFWEAGLKPCGSHNSPAWCDHDSEIAFRLDLAGYLESMVSGLKVASPGLEKTNVMDMVARVLSARTVVKAFPQTFLEPRAGQATAAYLEGGSMTSALALATMIRGYWFSKSPSVRQAFANFMDAATSITDAERDAVMQQLASSESGR